MSKLFGAKALDEATRLIASEIYDNIIPGNESKLEIEGRVGVLQDRSSDNRWKFPIQSETLLSSKCEQFKFESYLDEMTFRNINMFLNDKVNTSKNEQQKVTYKRTKECDFFYFRKETGEKIRVSVDPLTGKPLRSILKDKKKCFDFMCPQSHFDFRITIAIENSVVFEPTDTEIPRTERSKDRLSYEFDIWKVDITTVSEYQLDQFGVRELDTLKTIYEVEMEINHNVFFNEKLNIIKGGSFDGFYKIVGDLVQNMKTLVRKCEIPPPPLKIERVSQNPIIRPMMQPIVRHTPILTDKQPEKKKKTE